MLLAVATTVSSETITQSAIAQLDPHPTHSGIVSANPADNTPNVLNGHVNAFAQVGTTMIVGGQFTKVQAGGVTYDRSNLFAFNVTTGALITSFTPDVRGEVYDLQLTPSQTQVIAVGRFSSVAAKPHTQRVAALSVTTGAPDTSFVPPTFNKAVRDVHLLNNRYYVSGDFSKASGKARTGLATLGLRGKLTSAANLKITGTSNGGGTKVRSTDISPDGKHMIMVGNFAAVSGQRRPQIAMLDLSAKTTKLSPWSTNIYAPLCSRKFNSYMRDVEFSPDSTFFVSVTTGGRQGFQSNGKYCDSAVRFNVTAKPKQAPTWIDYTGGDTLTSVIIDTSVIYIGGHQRWVNNSYGRDSAGPGATPRAGIVALDPVNGMPYSWNPGRARGYGVASMLITDDGLWVGSDTAGFGGENRARIAFCPIAGGATLPSYATSGLPGDLLQLGVGTTDTVRTRTFNGNTGGSPTNVASSDSWQSVRGAFVVDGTLYSGWSDGTLRASSLASSPPVDRGTPIDLHGAFPDVSRVQTMFFDRATRRLYYSLNGSDTLYYRYFQPESQTVGSWRYKAPASSVNWTRVGGAFLVGTQLYYVNQSNGHIQKVGWQHVGRTHGSATTVLSNGNYKAAGMTLAPTS